MCVKKARYLREHGVQLDRRVARGVCPEEPDAAHATDALASAAQVQDAEVETTASTSCNTQTIVFYKT